jgi:DNA polymerase elongation subunit (family B)
LYGALGTKYFRWFDVRIAEAVTLSGQFAIQYAEKGLNNYLSSMLKEKETKDRIVVIDTDSTLASMDDFINIFKPKNPVEFLDQISKKKIEPEIDRLFKIFNDDILCGYKPRLSMKREVIASGFFVAKKHYVLNIYDNEGVRYTKPKLKIKGLAAIKSSTPKLVRNSMKETFLLILSRDRQKTMNYIDKIRKDFRSLPIERIAFPRGVSDIEKQLDSRTIYKKGCPIHVRAAILYNNLLNEKKLKAKYNPIRSGDKLKYVYLRMPNIIHENVIGFLNKLPTEFELQEFIDYNRMFDKTFMTTIEPILEIVGWGKNQEIEASMGDFFT